MTKEEIYKILIEYGKENNNIIDLAGLNFSYFNLDFSNLKAKKIDNYGQKSDIISNNYQEANIIYNREQKAENIYNTEKEYDKVWHNVGVYKRTILVKYEKDFEFEVGCFEGSANDLLEASTQKYGENNPYLEIIEDYNKNVEDK